MGFWWDFLEKSSTFVVAQSKPARCFWKKIRKSTRPLRDHERIPVQVVVPPEIDQLML